MTPPAPVRVTLSRARGWRMPPNTVKVCRPGPWGNPWIVRGARRGPSPPGHEEVGTVEEAIARYRAWVTGDPERLARARRELAGRNLACWCPADRPCHADVLLQIANSDAAEVPDRGRR